MATKTLNTRIKNKYDTEENWQSSNPILYKGEMAYSVINGVIKCKVGDGETNYSNLPFINNPDESAVIRRWNDVTS